MKQQNINETTLYKKNIKLHNNLWKVYTFTLLVGIIVVAVKGII